MEISNLSSDETSSDDAIEKSSSTDSVSLSNNSSDEDHADLLLFPLLHYLTNGRKRHRIEDYLVIIDSWTDEEFKEHLRLNRNTAQKLIGINIHYQFIHNR